jgi:transcriptional regulator with XRE-family HTH domain
MRISVHSAAYRELRSQLTKAREESNLTQAALADAIGRSQSFVSKYESGERKLDALEFAAIAAQLGIDPTHVLMAALLRSN